MGKDLKGKEIGKGIRQHTNGMYEARYVDRFGDRKSIYGTSKVEIKNKLAEALKEDDSEKSVRRKITLEKWYKEWFKSYKEPLIRPSTIGQYKTIFDKHILPDLGKFYICDINQVHIQSLINKLDKNGYQWETQNKVRLLLLDMFNIAIQNDYMTKNPAKNVKIKKIKPNDRIVLDIDQQRDFFRCSAGTFYHNLFVFAINSGLRAGEIFALEESDIDFDNHTISVTKTLSYQKYDGDTSKEFHIGEPKTVSSIRKVPMNTLSENAIKDQLRIKRVLSSKYKRDDDFKNLIFVTKFNTPICPQILNDAIKRIINEINLQRDGTDLFPTFSSHTFRHTFATRCIEAGIAPKVVQKYLGHSTLQMTMDLYVHISDDFKQQEIKKLDTVFPSDDDILM